MGEKVKLKPAHWTLFHPKIWVHVYICKVFGALLHVLNVSVCLSVWLLEFVLLHLFSLSLVLCLPHFFFLFFFLLPPKEFRVTGSASANESNFISSEKVCRVINHPLYTLTSVSPDLSKLAFDIRCSFLGNGKCILHQPVTIQEK
jgi:hypothetical protein